MHLDKQRPIAKLVAKCPFASRLKLRKSSFVKMVANANCLMALGLLIAASFASASVTSTTSQQASKQSASTSISDLGVTQSYNEAIKWSFGGWEPLSQQQKALKNATLALGNQQAQHIAPNQQRLNGTRPIVSSQAPRQSRQGGPELLSESASSSQNNIHFATGQQRQKSLGAHETNQLEQTVRQLQNGPAYAMQIANKRPQPPHEFSLPAPAPIVREQLLPAAPDQRGGGDNHQRHGEHRLRLAGPHQAHFIYPLQQSAGGMHMQPSNNQHQHQAPYQRMPEHQNHHHHQSRRPQFPLHHHNNRHEQFMREMERRHKQHMMNHQRHQSHHLMMLRQQQQQHRNHKMQQQQQHENRGHAPAIPHPAVRHALMQAGQHETAPQNVATFKVIDGEQPVVFTAPQQLEATGHAPNRPNASVVHHQTAPYSQMAPQSAMAATEKDHLNYNQAMQQVSNSLDEHQRGQTNNNIQDVKQRQINNERHNDQQQQQDPSKQRYLTIPVAVETAGDKVLTPDDINEIEKHVINVLPDLSTADKLVKLADSQLDLAHIKSSVEQARKSSLESEAQQHQQQPQASPQHNHQQVSSIGPAELHQMNYEEHKSTMRQLENLARPTTPAGGNQYQQSVTSSLQQTQAHTTTSLAASAPAAQHQSVEPQAGYQYADEAGELIEPQYYAPAGPAQEVEPVDPEQMGGDYNLIKNDLLQNIHYEPTRARPAHSGGGSSHSSPMQTGSTPPMPYTATSRHQQQAQVNGHSSPSTTTVGVPTVTRYFHQGPAKVTHQNNNKPERNNLFGRLRPNQQQGYQTASTRTILGGRKVSEVMRPLVHTTPVPLTSPMHIPSVEPEKVDAIQFIAGNTASDRQPVVVEAHQLVTHTPDGGIDYSTGGMQQLGQSQQQQPSANQTYQMVEQQPQQQQQQFYPQANPNEESQGAIIEYVSISDQALNNALANQHQQQASSNGPVDSRNQQHTYEMSSTPEGNQQVYSSDQPQQHSPQPPLLYAYSTQQQQQQQHETQNQASTPTYNGPTESPQTMPAAYQNQQQHQQQQEPSLAAWSPSIASEHQQQQQHLELSGQSGPMQQLEFPATAGYNLFGQQQDEQQSMAPNYSNEQQDQQQQQQQEPEQDHHSKWRTKAGGRQPNPDAQYDGQMVKATQAEGEDDDDESQQQDKKGEHQIQQVMMIDDGQQPQHYQTTVNFANQLQHPAPNQAAGASQQVDQTDGRVELQQQHERANHYEHQQQPEATGASQAPYQSQGSTMNIEGFDSTSAYVGGAQMNHQTPSGGMRYSRPPQSFGQTSAASSTQQATSPFGYAKLDRDHQQQHLEQQRVEHQSQLAELMDHRQQQQYQTTTPMSVTTPSEQQQSHSEQEVRQEQEQQQPNQQVVGDSQTALLINPDGGHQTLQIPAILDQQSLIHDQDQNGGGPLTSSDDASSKQRHHQGHHQPVFQVYQAYYAPKDHKPLPGYVRLSLDEFNHLFKDAEIQFVDKNAGSLTASLMAGSSHDDQMQFQRPVSGNEQQADSNYDSRSQQDHMRASGSELQSIVVDRRSIADRRSSTAPLINATMSMDQEKLLDSDRKLRQLGQAAVKKIISIANSRQMAAKQQAMAANKLVMKRVQDPILTTPSTITTTATSKLNTAATSTTTTSLPSSSTDQKFHAKKLAAGNSPAKTSQIMPKKKNPLPSSGRNHSDSAQRDKTTANKKTKLDEHKKQVVKV